MNQQEILIKIYELQQDDPVNGELVKCCIFISEDQPLRSALRLRAEIQPVINSEAFIFLVHDHKLPDGHVDGGRLILTPLGEGKWLKDSSVEDIKWLKKFSKKQK